MTKKKLNMKSKEDRLKSKLDKLANIQEGLTSAEEEAQLLIESLLEQDPEAKEKYEKLQVTRTELQDEAVEVESEAKELAVEVGETVNGEKLQAVVNKGRLAWDNDLLVSWSILLPAIMEAKKQGAPYISIRKVKVSD